MIDTHQDISKLSRYWDLETIGITDDDNIPHAKSFEKFRDENIRMVGGKYSAKLPWRENHPPLPTNYSVCYARTRTMIRNLSPQLLDTYNTIITEQLSRGFIERVIDDDTTHGHYIPHHCVKKDSTTTPIRIVYDCSCRQSDNPSLNQCLETGPPLLNDMVGILLRFRVNEVAFTADIEKAFLNVQLDRHDRDYTKFLWLSNPDDPESAFNTYRFKVVLFGATCSPFILNAVVKTHLESNPGDASADLTMNTYMDNVISGVRSQSMSPESVSQSAINYYSVANDVMQKGGFKLRMWATNDPMLRQIAQNDGNNDPANSVNVVGLRWLTNNDMLTYAGDSNPNTSDLPTKREIVRTTSSLFDPLGLLAPVHVQAKLFIQQLWQENKQWDELLTDDLSPKWTSIRHELESAKDIVFRRPYFNGHSNSDYELHVFADASTRAYGAVTYLKRGNETAIVMAKTRIKPPKDMTLPRMELMAALIGARLAKFVTKELSNINLTKLWCDSQIVIHWLQSDKKLPIFVENRVKEIRATNFDQIKYCNTKDNPADLLTQGISAKELAQSELWWKGPFWLPTGDWPICELFDMDVLSCNAESCDTHTLCVNDVSPATDTVLHTTTVTAEHSAGNLQKVMDITHFSILGKLCVTAYVLRFISKLRKCTHVPQDKYISVLELRDAKRLWINAVQSDTFACELKSIQRNTKCALVYQLKLFIDSDGIIRCGGRFQNADLQYGQKFPILLPTKHPFTLLEIAHTHLVILHSGVGATITHLSQLWT